MTNQQYLISIKTPQIKVAANISRSTIYTYPVNLYDIFCYKSSIKENIIRLLLNDKTNSYAVLLEKKVISQHYMY